MPKTKLASSPGSHKRAKTNDHGAADEGIRELCRTAWECFQSFLTSTGPDNPDGDTDELLAILELLQIHHQQQGNGTNGYASFSLDEWGDRGPMVPDLLPVLHSVAATLVADELVGQLLLQQTSTRGGVPSHCGEDPVDLSEMDVQIRRLLRLALECLPTNALALSTSANLARMTQSLPVSEVCRRYEHAAACARNVRTRAIQWLEASYDEDEEPNENDDTEDCSIKEWMEILLLNQVAGVEWEGDDEASDEGDEAPSDAEDQEQPQPTPGPSASEKETTNEQDSSAMPERWSASAVESTARFMAATLRSILNDHDGARAQLQSGFDLTHRLHPNVWKGEIQKTNLKLSPVDPDRLEPALFPDRALPANLYERLCQVFAPDSEYWKESNYEQRGYYSFFADLPEKEESPSNLIEDIVCSHLLPQVKSRLSAEQAASIVGYEWWVHTRPLQANLGHNLHFDTDEALLRQSREITHPIFSSVLYLTGSTGSSGPTFILDQTPDAEDLPTKCWYQHACNNSFLVFPGNLLHGVLPCPGNRDRETGTVQRNPNQDDATDLSRWLEQPLATITKNETEPHRLTFMVGFWTRRVPDTMDQRSLYGPCGPLPPDSPEHSWVSLIREGYSDNGISREVAAVANIQPVPVAQVSPVWEALDCTPSDPPLVLPKAIDHRFFVRDAPRCFRDSLMERDEFDEEEAEDEEHYHDHDHHHENGEHSHDHDHDHHHHKKG